MSYDDLPKKNKPERCIAIYIAFNLFINMVVPKNQKKTSKNKNYLYQNLYKG